MKVFSKEKWLETANAQKEQKILSQREIDDACEIWVDEMDGKSVEELTALGHQNIREDWLVNR
nr:MAG TPA: hypothetical protein [Caudoviricetes sp.]